MLWWVMLLTGVLAAAVSLVTANLDRRQVQFPTRRQRFILHLVSYCFMTLSILAFVARGLTGPA